MLTIPITPPHPEPLLSPYHYGNFYSTATSFEMITLHRKRTLIPPTPNISQAKRSILSGPVRRAYRTFQNVIFRMSLFPT